MHGKIVKELALDNMTFDIQALKTGVYFLEVNSSNSNEIIRLIKE
jgi:glutathione synthase/RimK-type ligase-like ATP-grasp enzyme